MSELDFFSAAAQLGDIKHLDVAAMELLYRVEMSGDVFYDKLASAIGNDEVAVLLRRNGREEVGHARRIRKAIDLKAGPSYVAPPELEQLYEVPLPRTIDPGLFEAIVAAELAGDAGYQGWAKSEPDEEIKRLLLLNGREETIHGDRVREAIAILATATNA